MISIWNTKLKIHQKLLKKSLKMKVVLIDLLLMFKYIRSWEFEKLDLLLLISRIKLGRLLCNFTMSVKSL